MLRGAGFEPSRRRGVAPPVRRRRASPRPRPSSVHPAFLIVPMPVDPEPGPGSPDHTVFLCLKCQLSALQFELALIKVITSYPIPEGNAGKFIR